MFVCFFIVCVFFTRSLLPFGKNLDSKRTIYFQWPNCESQCDSVLVLWSIRNNSLIVQKWQNQIQHQDKRGTPVLMLSDYGAVLCTNRDIRVLYTFLASSDVCVSLTWSTLVSSLCIGGEDPCGRSVSPEFSRLLRTECVFTENVLWYFPKTLLVL